MSVRLAPSLQKLAEEDGFDYDRVLGLLHKSDRVAMFLEFQDRFELAELKQLLQEWWPDVERPKAYGYERLLRLFKRVGALTDGPELPAVPLTIYRGVSYETEAAGISWTTDLWQAIWFAQRFVSKVDVGLVYGGEIEPQDVLGVFNERQEKEVIVDPRTVKALRKLGVVQGCL